MIGLAAAISFFQLGITLQIHLRPTTVRGHLCEAVPGGRGLDRVAGYPTFRLHVTVRLELAGFAGVREVHDEPVGLQLGFGRRSRPARRRIGPFHDASGQSFGRPWLAGLTLLATAKFETERSGLEGARISRFLKLGFERDVT